MCQAKSKMREKRRTNVRRLFSWTLQRTNDNCPWISTMIPINGVHGKVNARWQVSSWTIPEWQSSSKAPSPTKGKPWGRWKWWAIWCWYRKFDHILESGQREGRGLGKPKHYLESTYSKWIRIKGLEANDDHTLRNVANSWSASHGQQPRPVPKQRQGWKGERSTRTEVGKNNYKDGQCWAADSNRAWSHREQGTYFSLRKTQRMSSRSYFSIIRATYFSGRDITTEDCSGREVAAECWSGEG